MTSNTHSPEQVV